ncbi:MAG: MBL fold metallo-hydrolase [Betaproteobacteria bacterium]
MNRPTFFRRAARFVLAASLVLATGFALAEASPAQTQVPGYYHATLGKFQITALYDGPIALDTKLLKNTPPKDIRKLLARLFVNGPAVQTAVNAFIINADGKLILVDAGAAKLFGPSLGHIVDNLKAAGYRPEQVDVVLITHLHGDHVNGLVSADGQRVFPQAEIWSARADNEFWLSEEVAAMASKDFQPFFKMSRDAAAPYLASGQWKTFDVDHEFLPGIRSLDTHGHTPGHTSYLLESAGEQMVILGDLVHNHAVQFARPETAIEFDIDAKQAVVARKKTFNLAAREKMLVGGMHLPFPGLGHIRKEGKAFAWVPVEFAPLPALPGK